MPVVSTAKMTARQFVMLGEDPPGVRLELVNGEVAVSPSARALHSYPDRVLTELLMGYVRRNKLGIVLGDVDTVFSEYDVRRPDLLYFSNARRHLVHASDALAPPDLCVEVLSPSSDAIDRKDKFAQYAASGVLYYWIVDPSIKTIEGFQLVNGSYELFGSGSNFDVIRFMPFPELEIPLGEIWLPAEFGG